MNQAKQKPTLAERLLPHKDDTYKQRDRKAAGLTFIAGIAHGVAEELTGGFDGIQEYELLGKEHITAGVGAGVVGMGISASKTQEHINKEIPMGNPASKAVIGGIRYLTVPGLLSGTAYITGVGVGRLTTVLARDYLLK